MLSFIMRNSCKTLVWYAEPPTRSLGGDPIGNGIQWGIPSPRVGGGKGFLLVGGVGNNYNPPYKIE